MALDDPLTGTPEARLKDIATLLRGVLASLDAFLDTPEDTEELLDQLAEARPLLHSALELAQGRLEQ